MKLFGTNKFGSEDIAKLFFQNSNVSAVRAEMEVE